MQIAFLMFNEMTALDILGAYDAITRLKTTGILPDLTWQWCGDAGIVLDDRGLRFTPDLVRPPLGEFDMVVVGGGMVTRRLMHDQDFIGWIRTAESASLKASICTGALLLGAAGFLKGKRATTNPPAYHELEPYCAQVVQDRVVDEGDVITARGVMHSIDCGLHVVRRLAGDEAYARIRQMMDYRFEAGVGAR